MYAKDLSRKVKSAKRTRAAQGAFIGSHAPYGYKQSHGNCNVLEINEETAPVVQLIFEWALGGMGAVSIAKRLRYEKVLTPAAYKVKCGESHFVHLFDNSMEDTYYRWAYTTVHRILGDRVYLGHMIGHKSQVEHYKTKKRSPVPKSEQLVVENTHTPLVSQEDFDKVQLLIRTRHCPKHDEGDNLFQALLYCDECGHRLSMATKVYKSRSVKYYRCMHHYHFPEECSGTHYIRFDHVYQIVLDDIKRIGDLLTCRSDRLVEMLFDSDDERRNRLLKQQAKLQSRMDTIDTIIRQLYEDFAAKKTTVHSYNQLLSQYQKEQGQAQDELNVLRVQTADDKDQLARLEKLRGVVKNHLTICELKAPILHELIDKIHVGQRQKQNGMWQQDIRIAYRFAGEIPEV